MAMDLDEVVRVVALYCRDDGQTLEEEQGDVARDVIEDIVELLEAQLSDEAPFAALWRDFRDSPEENIPDLIGALEVMEEANPQVRERLEALYELYDFDQNTASVEPDDFDRIGEGTLESEFSVIPDTGDLSTPSFEAVREDQIPMDPDERERFNEEEVTGETLRHPYYPDYVDESNTYLVGDIQDDQSTSPSMYFDDEGSNNADYSALPESEMGDWDEADDEDADIDPDQIA